MRLIDRLDSPRSNSLLLLASIAIAVLLLMNAVVGATWGVNLLHQRALSQARAGQLALALASHARVLAETANAYGRSAAVLDALASGDAARISAVEAQIAGALPAAHSVRLIALPPLGIADPGFDPAQLSNNIEAHLVGSAFKGKASAPEAYALDGHWVVALAAPVRSATEESARGVLIFRIAIRQLLAKYIAPDTARGSYSLWAKAPRSGLALIAAAGVQGVADDPYMVDSGIGAMRAGFTPAAPLDYVDAIQASSPMLVFLLIGGAVLALLTGFTARRSMVQLSEDATKLAILASRRPLPADAEPRMHFKELATLASILGARRASQRPARAEDSDTAQPPERAPGPALRDPNYQNPLDIATVDEADAADRIGYTPEQADPVPDEIFRDYDIRGTASVLAPLAYNIGQAIGSEALVRGRQSLAVGADGRNSSPALREQLVRGLLASGVDVIDIGMVATPMLYFACHHLQTFSGVMVTGSHNPADNNGFKIMLDGETLCGERIKAIRQRIIDGDFREGQGSYRVSEIDADYQKAIVDDILVDAPLRVALDCGNGSAAVVAVGLFEELGCEVLPMFCDIDGDFPNHQPDPSVPGNLRHLLAEVARQRADLGIAFDGDGDRIGVVSASGRIVGADRLLMLFARDVLSRNPGADIVFDVKCSRDLSSIITQYGGRPILCRSGHSWIKEKMKESGALLGGEFTGHICFRDRWLGFDDALYAAARLLEILTTESRSLDELLAELPQAISTPEIRIELPEQRKFEIMDKLAEKLAFDDARLIRIDGVRAEFADGWGLVRASNTSAALILRFEAQSESALSRIESLFRAELTRILPADIGVTF